MKSVLEVLPVVVSDVKTDGSFQKPERDVIRDKIIEDGGSVEFAMLRNWYENVLTSSKESRVIIVPTQTGMEKSYKKGTIKKQFFATHSPELRKMFNISDCYGNKSDNLHNVEHLHVYVDEDIVTFMDKVSLKIVKKTQLKFRSHTIDFIYISGILITSDIRKMLMK